MQEKLNTAPYKGVRDFYPEDMWLEKYMFSKMRETAERFGFVEYGASPLEPAELYRSKTSEEIVNEQTYTFTDRGDREVTLRPEMTPTVARMVAGKKRDLGLPLRWYSIPNLFRYENPQRGRLREHYQFNVDLFGVSDLSAESEVILLAYELMKSFGAKDENFEIRINSRKNKIKGLDGIEMPPEKMKEVTRLLDKKEKMKPAEFSKKAKELTGIETELEFENGEETTGLITTLQNLGVKNVVFSPTLTRGFDYYTGVVFEIFDTNPKNRRSLFGGGRYDNLLELFGGESVPAVGFGMGDVTLRDFLETHGLLPEYEPETKAVLATIGEIPMDKIFDLAQKIRGNGINLGLNTKAKKPADAIKAALKNKINWIIFVGETELENKEYTLKNLKTEESFALKEDELIKKLLS